MQGVTIIRYLKTAHGDPAGLQAKVGVAAAQQAAHYQSCPHCPERKLRLVFPHCKGSAGIHEGNSWEGSPTPWLFTHCWASLFGSLNALEGASRHSTARCYVYMLGRDYTIAISIVRRF